MGKPYSYEYVRLPGKGTFSKEWQDHRGIIDEYAKKGYRYVGWFPTFVSREGVTVAVDLIFERETEREAEESIK